VSERRGRGRRDNGLDATLWSPLRDVDPRVGEHLLDVLEAAGIPAYLEPSADVGPYTRTVFLPSPPTDRLYVDRSRRSEARGIVDEHADDHPPGRTHPRPPLRADLDEEAEWAGIVAALEADTARPAADDEPPAAPPAPPQAPRPLPPAPPEQDLPEEHYEPPAPPPLPVPAPASLYAVLLVAIGLILIGVPSVIGLSFDVGLILGVVAIAAGVAVLLTRMRERSVDDGDDGAVV
jgi:hypothetical protein